MGASFLEHKIKLPGNAVNEFVERFWMVRNDSDQDQEVVVVPDGRIDLMFTIAADGAFTPNIIGIENEPSQHKVSKGSVYMGVGLKLLAVEYCLKYSIAPILGKTMPLIAPHTGVTASDLYDFNSFCHKTETAFKALVPASVDERKQTLFNVLYSTQGSLTIQEYSQKCRWTSRQINRYFRDWFGLSLKEYCSILRFRASIGQIKKGIFFPERNYSDQPHFIREVKKYTGVTPKELFKRQNDRFIQLSEG